MTDLQIKYFLHLGRTGNVTETARQLYVAQPAVSKQITALEKEMDLRLFDRTNRGVRLTEAGKRLYAFFGRVSADYAELLRDLQANPQEHISCVNIGILENMESERVKQAAMQYMNQYPDLRINLYWSDNDGLLEQLANGKLDLAITFDHAFGARKGIVAEKLALVQTLFAISADHPLAKKEDLCCQDLSGQIFCVPPQRSSVKSDDYLTQTLETLHIEPGGFVQANNMVSGLAAVELNRVVALLDEWVSVPNRSRFRLIGTGIYHNIVAARLSANRDPKLELIMPGILKCFAV